MDSPYIKLAGYPAPGYRDLVPRYLTLDIRKARYTAKPDNEVDIRPDNGYLALDV